MLQHTEQQPSRGQNVSRRFEYERMKPNDFRDELAAIDMPSKAFARIFGVNSNVVDRWIKGDQDIPAWVYVALSLIRLPEGFSTARQAAAQHIKKDNLRPELGDYPYLSSQDQDFLEGDEE
jgi:DNA-binding transcriptional regulator YdaS (Cro superfamily)